MKLPFILLGVSSSKRYHREKSIHRSDEKSQHCAPNVGTDNSTETGYSRFRICFIQAKTGTLILVGHFHLVSSGPPQLRHIKSKVDGIKTTKDETFGMISGSLLRTFLCESEVSLREILNGEKVIIVDPIIEKMKMILPTRFYMDLILVVQIIHLRLVVKISNVLVWLMNVTMVTSLVTVTIILNEISVCLLI